MKRNIIDLSVSAVTAAMFIGMWLLWVMEAVK